MVDLVGIEPTTSSMPWKRAPSCATGPRVGKEWNQHHFRVSRVDSQTDQELRLSESMLVFVSAMRMAVRMRVGVCHSPMCVPVGMDQIGLQQQLFLGKDLGGSSGGEHAP